MGNYEQFVWVTKTRSRNYNDWTWYTVRSYTNGKASVKESYEQPIWFNTFKEALTWLIDQDATPYQK